MLKNIVRLWLGGGKGKMMNDKWQMAGAKSRGNGKPQVVVDHSSKKPAVILECGEPSPL